jgi:hypothetical protein
MRKRIAALGDRMLAAALPRGTAGACLPTMSCSYEADGVCWGNYYYESLCTGKTNCQGQCKVGVTCGPRRKVGAC